MSVLDVSLPMFMILYGGTAIALLLVLFNLHLRVRRENVKLEFENEMLGRSVSRFMKLCDHEWVDARNEAVESGEVCIRCWKIRSGNAETREE